VEGAAGVGCAAETVREREDAGWALGAEQGSAGVGCAEEKARGSEDAGCAAGADWVSAGAVGAAVGLAL
jgi:hypothetical protein